MSNLMQVLANARGRRYDAHPDAAAHGDQVMTDRTAEANALAHAGADDRASADARQRQHRQQHRQRVTRADRRQAKRRQVGMRRALLS